jgi:hypothetical protein
MPSVIDQIPSSRRALMSRLPSWPCSERLFFGTKGGYYDSDDYDGNGTAH